LLEDLVALNWIKVEVYYGCDLVIMQFLVFLSVVIQLTYSNLLFLTLKQK